MEDVNGSGMKRAVLINDLSCFGKCSLSVSIPIVSSYGIEAVPLPSAVLSTHTGGFENYVVRDMTEDMKSFADHWKSFKLKADCIYTGYFSSVRQIEIAERFIDDFADKDTLILVDPVLGDNGRLYAGLDASFTDAMRRLIKKADAIVPNVTEASLLTGCGMDSGIDGIIEKLNVPNVVVTGVRDGDFIGYEATLGGERIKIKKPYVDRQLHGAGDVFASAFCGEMLAGADMKKALENAAGFCEKCIEATARRQPAHWYGLAFEDVLKNRRTDAFKA